jgi:hypothetical protein
MGEKQPGLFGDMEDDASMDAVSRKESALGDLMDWRRAGFSKWFHGPMAGHLLDMRSKHMPPGDYDDLDDRDPGGFDEFGGEF